MIMSFWKKITSLFDKVVSWFSNLLTMNDEIVKKYAPIAIDVCNVIKKFNASSQADAVETIVSVIATKWGSTIAVLVRNWITNNIDKVISGLNIADESANATTVSEKIVLISNYISTLELDNKSVTLTEIASLLAKDFSDGKLSLAEIAVIVTTVYKAG